MRKYSFLFPLWSTLVTVSKRRGPSAFGPSATATSGGIHPAPPKHACILTEWQVPYTPVSSSNNTAGLDPATQERLERMENVLSVVVRHNPGMGGYDAVREWLNCEFYLAFMATRVCALAPLGKTSTTGRFPA